MYSSSILTNRLDPQPRTKDDDDEDEGDSDMTKNRYETPGLVVQTLRGKLLYQSI
jgi:hypothetical protein